MHCVIHIGTHKTGSTSIQLALSRARASLASQGILYPAQPGLRFTKFVCHHRLASQLNGLGTFFIDDAWLGPNLSELQQAIEEATPEYLVLSSEAFSDTSKERDIENSPLMRLLQSRCESVRVVCAVRPQAEFLQSAYIEEVKNFSYFGSFAEFRQNALTMRALDHGKNLAPWLNRRMFGFSAVPFNKSIDPSRLPQVILIAGGIPESVVEAAGIPASERINANPGAMTIAALRRAIPMIFELQKDPQRDSVKQWFYQEAEARGWTETPFHSYTAADIEGVAEHFRERNSQFAMAQWGKDWDEVFENPAFRSRMPTEVDLDKASPEVLSELDDFIAKMQSVIKRIQEKETQMPRNPYTQGWRPGDSRAEQSSTNLERGRKIGSERAPDDDYSWARDLTEPEWIEFLAGERTIDDHVAPAMPDPAVQRRYVGAEGVAALKSAAIFCEHMRSVLEESGASWDSDARVLDFGIGWGRVYRLLMREVDPTRLVGVDVDPVVLDIFKNSIPNGAGFQVPFEPPYSFDDGSFHTIYMDSVFSHLNRRDISLILTECARILQPGGFLFFTTLRQAHLNVWARQADELSKTGSQLRHVNFNLEDWTHKLNDEGYLHLPSAPSAESQLLPSYGLTILTKTFLEQGDISSQFDVVRFDEPANMLQAFAVLRRR